MFSGGADGAVNTLLHNNTLWFWLVLVLCFFVISLNKPQAGKRKTLLFPKNFRL